MKYPLVFYLILCIIKPSVLAQTKYTLSVEKITRKPNELIKLQDQRIYYPSGHKEQLLVYQMNMIGVKPFGYSAEASMKIYYDEKTMRIIDSISLRQSDRKILRINQQNNLTLFHGFYNVPAKFTEKLIDELDRGEFLLDYQDIWIENKGTEQKLKSYSEHYYDKDVEYKVEGSGKYTVISTYVSEDLRSTIKDSVIGIYGPFNENGKSLPSKEISCIECIRPQIVGNCLYYGKKFF